MLVVDPEGRAVQAQVDLEWESHAATTPLQASTHSPHHLTTPHCTPHSRAPLIPVTGVLWPVVLSLPLCGVVQSVFCVRFVASLPPLSVVTFFLHLSATPHANSDATQQSVTTIFSLDNRLGPINSALTRRRRIISSHL